MAAIEYTRHYAQYTRYFTRITELYQKRPEVRASIELLLTLLTISFFAVFALRPTLNTISELVSNIRSQRGILEKLDEKIDNLAAAQTIWSQEQARLTLLDEALPKEAEPDDYLMQIEGLSQAHGLSLTSFSIAEFTLIGKTAEEETENGFKIPQTGKIEVSFTVAGTYPALSSFFEELEELRRPIKIESFAFTEGTGTQEGSILLTVRGFVPFFLTE